ncbi:hypothetical protein Tco_1004110 [Tanacetum coccineum]|uniref:Retrovirus-related Pol polyprotein from transposon TNT 1-94 n=1 Tax=Tanacetum coccineum TaxID=301880 RepID=A0ABQ5FDA4_9ASTR
MGARILDRLSYGDYLKWIYKVKSRRTGWNFEEKPPISTRGYIKRRKGIDLKSLLLWCEILETSPKAQGSNIVLRERPDNELLLKYGFDSCDLVDTSMVEKSKLDEDKEGKAMDLSHYHGTVHRGRWYSKDSSIALTAFVDADHAGCQDTCRNTSGSMQLLGDRFVSWSSKRSMHIDIQDFTLSRSIVENGLIKVYFVNTGKCSFGQTSSLKLLPKRIEFLITSWDMSMFYAEETLKKLADEVDE